MVDVIDNYVSINITITAEGVATITCTNCTQTVVQNTTATVNYSVTCGSTGDTLFGQLWDAPGQTGGNMITPELFRETFAANQTKAKSLQIIMGTASFNGSIRVGHVV